VALTFTHATKYINVPQADAAPLLIQDLLNAIRAEEASERGIVYDQIVDASGKASLGGAVTVGITLDLLSTWKLNFAAGAYQATVDGGNLSDALNVVVNTGNPQVLFLASAAATLVTGTGGTAPTATQNANAVWAHADGAAVKGTTDEVHKIHGLDPAAPLVVTPASREAGAITQTIDEVGTTVTVERV
jgi:hypothetical protein